jgi:hypothetical protein
MRYPTSLTLWLTKLIIRALYALTLNKNKNWIPSFREGKELDAYLTTTDFFLYLS